MINSYFGLEKPLCLPPNFKLIGNINKEPTQLVEALKQKDMDLYNWLEDAVTKNETVVYVSLGTVCQWQPWSVNAIHKGLKQLGCRVVWALKEEYQKMLEEDPSKDPNFDIKGW